MRITRSRDSFFSEDFTLLSHRFTVASGGRATYDDRGLRLEVAPKSNGDSTFTIVSTFAEHSDTSAPARTQVTVVDGRATTHQVGGIRFIFLATTNPKLFESVDAAIPRITFVDGIYVQAPGSFAGDSYTFERGSFTCFGFTDAGPQPPPEKGRYQSDGERIILSFDGASAPTRVFTHHIVDGVHFLIDDHLVAATAPQKRIHYGPLFGYYILQPSHADDYFEWWRSIPKHHPEFAKQFPNSFQ